MSFSILPPSSNFIFTATISIYQLVNPINTGVFRTWNNQQRAVSRTNQKSSFKWHNLFFYSNTFFSLKNPYLKSVFFIQNCSLRVALNRKGFEKSLYVRTYVVKNWWSYKNILEPLRYRMHEILAQCTSYFLFGTWYLLCFDQNKQKSMLPKLRVNHW